MPSYSNQAAESTQMYELSPTTNYGTGATLGLGQTGSNRRLRSLIRFPSLPSGIKSVSNGKLYLYSHSEGLGADSAFNVYRNLRAWVEGQATWNIYSTGNNWGTAGASNTTSDYSNSSIGSQTVSQTIAANAEVVTDLDDTLLKEYLNNQSTYAGGFELIMAETSTYWWYPHSNDAATSTYRPKLTFDYTLGGGGLYWFM